MLYNAITALAVLSGCAIAAEIPGSSRNKAEARTIYGFPNNTYVENLAVRSNGQILVNIPNSSEVWLIDPEFPNRAVIVHEFSSMLGLSAIVEYEPDVFANSWWELISP